MPNLLPKRAEIIVSDATTTESVSRSVKNGTLRKLASRLYTTNLTDAPEIIVKRNLWQISGHSEAAFRRRILRRQPKILRRKAASE